MNQNLLFVLFSIILYVGVTYSSPTEVHLSDAKLPEEKIPTVPSVTEAIKKENKPVEPAPVTSSEHLTSGGQTATSVPQHIETSTAQNTTLIPKPVDKTLAPKSSNETIKTENQDLTKQNVSKVVENKTSSQTVENKNTSSTDNVTDVKIPTPPPSLNTSSTNNSSAGTSTTNSPSTKTLPTSTTPASTFSTPEKTSTISSSTEPTSTTMAKVVTGQSTPAPAEEKHFDGPSFIGGIVLTIGLTAIGFIAFKYYKSGKIDMNYRTL